MCPIYEDETKTREDLNKLCEKNQCLICGGTLNVFWDLTLHKAFLACNDYLRTQHEGIAKPASEYQQKGMEALNIPTRREIMEREFGTTKTRALERYSGVTSLTRKGAMEIMETIWPDAPAPDKLAAAILCSSYGLNPLANHVFLIPFGKGEHKTWARVWGIKAKRLLASRKGVPSYLDMTPRRMTEEEQIKVWGMVDLENLSYMTHLKDMKTGAEVYGYGKWPIKDQPYGTDKGNSQANMASIRSESQALDRLRPAEMPTGFAIVDEQYIEGETRVVDISKGGIKEPEDKGEIGDEDELASGIPPSESQEQSPETKPKRDSSTIKTFGDLYPACDKDFHLKTRRAVWAELNVDSQEEITDTPAECYKKIAATRGT